MYRFFDVHSHIHGREYDADRAEVLSRMREAGIGTITVGTHLETSKEAAALADKEADVWAAIGLHPTDTEEDFNAEEYRPLLKNKKVVVIGECGLDYFRLGENADAEKERQKKNFCAQLAFAKEANLPLMIHCRPSGKTMDAHEDMLVLLEGAGVSGNIHFFTGTLEIAQRYFKLGFSISIPGILTFTDEYDELVKRAPEEMLLSETDAPYASPLPYRGKRNEPLYVAETAKKMALLRGEDIDTFSLKLVGNASRVFGLGF